MTRLFSCTIALLLCAFIAIGCVPVEQATSEDGSPWLNSSEYITTTTQASMTTSTSETTTTSEVTKATTTTELTRQIEYPPADKVSAIVSTSKSTATTTTTTATTTTTSPPKAQEPNNAYIPLNYDTVYGIWISYLEYSSMLNGRTEQQFRQSFETAVKNSKGLGVNTLYVHVRAHGDAYYKSDLFPWATRVAGALDRVPSFDPLEVMIEIAHANKMSIHAWLNPMRALTKAEIKKLDNKYPIKKWYNDKEKNGTYIKQVTVGSDKRYYLNPGYPEVRKLIADGVTEIMKNYNVDGVHIDDYFYPTTSKSFDKEVVDASGKAMKQFRHDSTTAMVKAMYDAVKAVNNKALFGISPQGNVSNNLNSQFVDIERLCSKKGYIDYVAPQLYYSLSDVRKYAPIFNDYIENGDKSIKLIIGLGPYKIGTKSAYSDWTTNTLMIKSQIEIVNREKHYSGVIFFRYDSLFKPDNSVKKQVEKEIAAFKPLLK